jgi:hypothetical protein
MIPSQQCLEADDAVAGRVQDGLVLNVKLAASLGLHQIVGEIASITPAGVGPQGLVGSRS